MCHDRISLGAVAKKYGIWSPGALRGGARGWKNGIKQQNWQKCRGDFGLFLFTSCASRCPGHPHAVSPVAPGGAMEEDDDYEADTAPASGAGSPGHYEAAQTRRGSTPI